MSEDLQYRLYNASITPPGNAWPNIVAQLDKETEQKLSQKLQQAALMPPPNIWDNIQHALDEISEPAPVVYMPRRWNRVAVAAVTIGIIVLAGLFYFMSGDTAGDRTATRTTKQPDNRPSSSNNTNNSADPVTAAGAQTASRDNTNSNRNNTARLAIASGNNTPVRHARTENETLLAWGPDELNVDNMIEVPLSAETHNYITPKEYLTVTAPNGQPAKISARFTAAMDCIFNDEPAQSIDMALRNVLWKMRINKWSNKLVSGAGFIPSPGNFFDIMELEELLKE